MSAYDNCNRGRHSFATVDSTGWEICEFCGSRRHPERLAAAQKDIAYNDRRTEPRGKYAYQSCAWCGHTFVKNNMFHVGPDENHWMVCGPDCPKRPRRYENKKPVPGFTVTTTVQVAGTRVENATHAMNIVKKQAREGYRDSRLSGFEMTVTENK